MTTVPPDDTYMVPKTENHHHHLHHYPPSAYDKPTAGEDKRSVEHQTHAKPLRVVFHHEGKQLLKGRVVHARQSEAAHVKQQTQVVRRVWLLLRAAPRTYRLLQVCSGETNTKSEQGVGLHWVKCSLLLPSTVEKRKNTRSSSLSFPHSPVCKACTGSCHPYHGQSNCGSSLTREPPGGPTCPWRPAPWPAVWWPSDTRPGWPL